MMDRISTRLRFDGQDEEAAKFWTGLVPDRALMADYGKHVGLNQQAGT